MTTGAAVGVSLGAAQLGDSRAGLVPGFRVRLTVHGAAQCRGAVEFGRESRDEVMGGSLGDPRGAWNVVLGRCFGERNERPCPLPGQNGTFCLAQVHDLQLKGDGQLGRIFGKLDDVFHKNSRSIFPGTI